MSAGEKTGPKKKKKKKNFGVYRPGLIELMGDKIRKIMTELHAIRSTQKKKNKKTKQKKQKKNKKKTDHCEKDTAKTHSFLPPMPESAL